MEHVGNREREKPFFISALSGPVGQLDSKVRIVIDPKDCEYSVVTATMREEQLPFE
jgi:hypothetical protein